MNRRLAWAGVALSTLFILVATLHVAGRTVPPGWSFALASGNEALAELIQNLLLFMPLGASLTLVGVPPLRAVAIGTALSFSVEFAQQWIPGRDPSVGDIVINAASTGLGVAVAAARRWLWASPALSARLALGIAVTALLVWTATGLLLRPVFPDPPYRDAWTPDVDYWGRYRGKVLAARWGPVTLAQDTIGEGQFLLKTGQALEVTVIAPNRPPRRESPFIALFDERNTQVLMFVIDGADLVVLHHMKALALTLEEVDLRWRHALARVAPEDTFVVQTWRGEYGVCLSVNSARRCGFGYTIGDGWKLIFYPEHFPAWLYLLLNICWMVGWTVGVGWWAARATAAGKAAAGTAAADKAAAGTTAAAGNTAAGKAAAGTTAADKAAAVAAAAVVLLGLIVVPMMTGLKTTPILEWIGALGGLGLGTYLTRHFSTPPTTPFIQRH